MPCVLLNAYNSFLCLHAFSVYVSRYVEVYALDGNAYYARPGPRLLQGSGIIARLLHGGKVGEAIGADISPADSWTVVVDPQPERDGVNTPPQCLDSPGTG